MATTTNFGWTTPDNTGYVKDGALAIRTLGSAIDTSMAELRGGTTGQVLKKASNADMDLEWGTVSSTPRIGQVVQTTTTSSTSSTSTTYADASGMSLSITPTLSTSKVLVTMSFDALIAGAPSTYCAFTSQIVRGSTAIYSGALLAAYTTQLTSSAVFNQRMTLVYLDSPATTSATTYKLQFAKGSGGTNSDFNAFGSVCSVVLQEVLV